MFKKFIRKALTGESLFPSLLLVFLMWERLRNITTEAARDKPPPRPYWTTYRWQLWVGGAVCFGVDLLLGVLRNTHVDQTAGAQAVYALVMLFFIIACGMVAYLFVKAAMKVSQPLLKIQRSRASGNLVKRRDVERIVVVLAMNGLMGIAMTITEIWTMAEIATGLSSPVRLNLLQIYFINCRLWMAYWHIQAIRPAVAVSSTMILVSEFHRMTLKLSIVLSECVAGSMATLFGPSGAVSPDPSITPAYSSGGCLAEIEDMNNVASPEEVSDDNGIEILFRVLRS
jgi:hypothetical protein